MRRSTFSCLGLFLMWVMAGPALAAESPLYGGLKIGTLDADLSGFEDTTSFGVMLGYDLHRDANGTLALEGEYTTTISDGNISGGGEWDADTFSAVVAYRTAGSVYIKAKAGILDQNIHRSGGPLNVDDSGIVYGAGVGWRPNSKLALELEFTQMSDELSLLSLALITHF